MLALDAALCPTLDGNVLTISTPEPERHAATVLAAAAGHVERLRSVRILPASLEDVYVAATGEALAEEGR